MNRKVDNKNRLIVSGTVNLILGDGARLFVADGIKVSAGNTLNIYCQSNSTGELYCEADTNDNAAIGSDDHGGDCGTINIYGGIITADTYAHGEDAAGIGGGEDGHGGTINISGGDITAIGGNYGAAIGGGCGGNSGNVRISGGNITADADVFGVCGIGTGRNAGKDAVNDTIRITGGTINATGSDGAGIGAGPADNSGDSYGPGRIEISNANVIVSSGAYSAIGGAFKSNIMDIIIQNSTVTGR